MNQDEKKAPLLAAQETKVLEVENDGMDLIVDGMVVDSKATKQMPKNPIAQVFQGYSAFYEAGFLSKMMFSWVSPVLSQAKQDQLSVEQFGTLHETFRAEYNVDQANEHFNRYLSKEWSSALLWAVFRTFRSEILFTLFLNVWWCVFTWSSPFLILFLINFIQSEPADPTQPLNAWVNLKWGVYYTIMLVVSQLCLYILQESLYYLQTMTGYKAANLVATIVYNKHEKISSATNKEFLPGDVVNFVQVDSQKFIFMFKMINDMTAVPFFVIVCFTALYFYLQWAFFAGFIVFVIAFVVNLVLGMQISKQTKLLMEKKDTRMTATNEALNNIKMLKLYSWQQLFENQIQEKRAEEVKAIGRQGCVFAIMIASITFFPSLMPAVCFATYIGFDLQPTLDLGRVTFCLIFFSQLGIAMNWAPICIKNFLELKVSMKRVQSFLLVDEVQHEIRKRQQLDNNDALRIQGNFTWGFEEKKTKEEKKKAEQLKKEAEKNKTQVKDEFGEKSLRQFMTLNNLDLNLKKGEFVCIIGDVGSGKSSLLNAVIGDMIYLSQSEIDDFGGLDKLSKKEDFDALRKRVLANEYQFKSPIQVDGTLALVEQQSWIQNCTIRDNILFNRPMDLERYINTVAACQLESDLAILPAGDLTEIGEKGINLSGGQKARVSLARAVYANKDIVLMDDPISALDANVRKLIFNQVFQGMLKEKTRILVTHAVDFLHLADKIIVMSQGQVKAVGTYNELQDDEHLKKVLSIYKKQNEENQNLRDSSVSNNELRNTVSNSIYESQNNQSQLLAIQRQTVASELSTSRLSYKVAALMKQDQSQSLIEIEEQPFQLITDKSELQRRFKAIQTFQADGSLMTIEADEVVTVKGATYYRLMKSYGGWPLVIAINLCMIGFMMAQIYSSECMMAWANESEQEQKQYFNYYVTIIFTASFVTALLVLMRFLIIICGVLRSIKLLHNYILNKVLCAPINLFYDVTPIGKILNRFSKDLSVMDSQIMWSIGGFLNNLYMSLGSLAVACYVVPYTLVAVMIMVIVGFIIFRYMITGWKECYRLDAVTKSPLLSFLQETQNGSTIIRAYDMTSQFRAKNLELCNTNTLVNQVGGACWGWYATRIGVCSTLVLASACAFCITERDTIQQVLLALLLRYIITLQVSLLWSLSSFGNLSKQMMSVQRFIDLEKTPQENNTNEIEVDESWPRQGLVEFKDVTLKYRPTTQPVLMNLTFIVKAGTKIGVVGRTGAGKSTICISLSRIVELFQGCIKIDGVDISKIKLSVLRDKVTVIPQDPTLFNGSLKYNLDPFNTIQEDSVIEELLERAGLSNLLHRKDDADEQNRGIHMKISEGGKNLSSGERQLICICRAILRKNKIVVLDEATANIDVVTEQKIQTLINEEFLGSTVITIAHRLNTIIRSDYVLVLSRGEVVEYDSPNQLMANPDSEFTQLLKELQKKKQ